MTQDLPKHIAFIMDGNRRWAKANSLPLLLGHKNGIGTFEKILEVCAKKGIKSTTFYAFSTENWNRKKEEVSGLMLFLSKNCDRFSEKCMKNNLKANIIGNMDKFKPDLREKLVSAIEKTKKNTGMTINVALSYGGREEIVNAAKKCVEEGYEITQENLEKCLYTYPQDDPDMIVRTGGEMRLSNFLTWQSTYSELYFTETLWPDFGEEELNIVLEEYSKRKRRFGK